jgi:hypothetical protein
MSEAVKKNSSPDSSTAVIVVNIAASPKSSLFITHHLFVVFIAPACRPAI